MRGVSIFVAFAVGLGFQASAQAFTSALNPLLQYETDLAAPAVAPDASTATGAGSEPAVLITEPAKQGDGAGELRPVDASWATSAYYKNGMPI
jgi:hypothetical protein